MTDNETPIRWFFIATNRGDIVGRPADEGVTSVDHLRGRLINDGYITLDRVMSPKADQIVTKKCISCEDSWDLNDDDMVLVGNGRHAAVVCNNVTCKNTTGGACQLNIDETRYKIRYTDMVGTYDTNNVTIFRDNISWISPVEDQEMTAKVAEELCNNTRAAVFEDEEAEEAAEDSPVVIHIPQ